MKATDELRRDYEAKVRSDALNTYMLTKEEELEYVYERVAYYQNVCAGLIISIVLITACGSWVIYKQQDAPACEQTKEIATKQGGEAYLPKLERQHVR
jgi:hypothetical protein